MTIGKIIQRLRDDKDLNQKELAEKIGLSHSVMNRIELGTRPARDDELKRIAEVLDVSLDYLMGASDIKNPYSNRSLSTKDEKDIAKDLENTLNRLEGAQDGLLFDGETLDDETRELLKISLENSMRLAKQIAKKYTPNKYEK